MKENKLVDLSKQFAVDIVNLCTEIKENRKSNVLLNQLLRSGTSIGANIHEANYAASKADFINKFQILFSYTNTYLSSHRYTASNCSDGISKFFRALNKSRHFFFCPLIANTNLNFIIIHFNSIIKVSFWRFQIFGRNNINRLYNTVCFES